MLSSTLPQNLLKKNLCQKPSPKIPFSLAACSPSHLQKISHLFRQQPVAYNRKHAPSHSPWQVSHSYCISNSLLWFSEDQSRGSTWLSKSPPKQAAWKWAPHGGLHTPKAFYQALSGSMFSHSTFPIQIIVTIHSRSVDVCPGLRSPFNRKVSYLFILIYSLYQISGKMLDPERYILWFLKILLFFLSAVTSQRGFDDSVFQRASELKQLKGWGRSLA